MMKFETTVAVIGVVVMSVLTTALLIWILIVVALVFQ